VTGISRRAFLRSGVAVTVLSAVPVALVPAAFGAPAAGLTRSRFAPLVGTTFRMTGGGDNLDVVLSEIHDLVPVRRSQDEKRFALRFDASRAHRRTEGIRTLHHPQVGNVVLFVSPVDRGVKALHYEAVINCR
jgi:hypothetical protein